MNRWVGMESQAINQKAKYLMCIAVIQCLFGKTVLYENNYITYKDGVYKYEYFIKIASN